MQTLYRFATCDLGRRQTEIALIAAVVLANASLVLGQQRSIGGWEPATVAEKGNAQTSRSQSNGQVSPVQQAAYKPQQDTLPPIPPVGGAPSAATQPNLLPPPNFPSASSNPPMPVTNAATSNPSTPLVRPSEVFGPSSGTRPRNGVGNNAANIPPSTGVRTKGGNPQPPQAGIRNVSQSNQAAPMTASQNQVTPRQRGAQIASGLPYVTPRPNGLGGRYPTSPYSGPRYQPATYRPSQIPTNQTVQTPSRVPAQTVSAAQGPPASQNLAAGQSALPQFSNTPLANNPNIYPTAYQQCLPQPSLPPASNAYIPPTLTPNVAPGVYSTNNSGYAPLFSLGQENYNVQLGRGIIGQPTVYVPGQPFRNFFRYLSP